MSGSRPASGASRVPTDEFVTRSQRATALYKLPKSSLVAIWRDGPGRNVVYTAHPVSQWLKDEIVSEILCHEYPTPAHDCGHTCCDERSDPMHDHFLAADNCPSCVSGTP